MLLDHFLKPGFKTGHDNLLVRTAGRGEGTGIAISMRASSIELIAILHAYSRIWPVVVAETCGQYYWRWG
jgi:hypothetical protein